jgi:hypothetical protein
MSVEIDRASAELADALRGDAATERAHVEALLWPAYKAKVAAKQYDEVSPAIKEWLGLHEGETLLDGEHGVTARLQRGGGRGITDLRPLTEQQVLDLWGYGLLDVKWGVFDALRKAAPRTTWDAIANTPGVRTSPEQWNLFMESIEQVGTR